MKINFNPLYTNKGSKIWYSKYRVGKYIGGKIYVHKDYALDVIPMALFLHVQDVLYKKYPDFEYNCICYDFSNCIIRFDQASGFNTDREPVVGKMISYDFCSGEFKENYSTQIWHHKWLWVLPDYQGFDIQESYDWSKLWLSKLEEPASGSKSKWEEQLAKYGLT